MELCRPDSPFKLFETSRYISPTSKKGKGKATPEATPEVAPSEPAPTLEPGRTLLEVAEGSQASSCAPRSSPARSGASTPTKREFGAPLDLGVRSLKAYQVHEHLRLYGSAADITSEEDEEMQTDEAQLRADVSSLRASLRSYLLTLTRVYHSLASSTISQSSVFNFSWDLVASST